MTGLLAEPYMPLRLFVVGALLLHLGSRCGSGDRAVVMEDRGVCGWGNCTGELRAATAARTMFFIGILHL